MPPRPHLRVHQGSIVLSPGDPRRHAHGPSDPELEHRRASPPKRDRPPALPVPSDLLRQPGRLCREDIRVPPARESAARHRRPVSAPEIKHGALAIRARGDGVRDRRRGCWEYSRSQLGSGSQDRYVGKRFTHPDTEQKMAHLTNDTKKWCAGGPKP